MEKMPKIIIKEALRKCGHPFQPTFDMTVVQGENLVATSYCAYCMVEKLGLKPCAKCIINKNAKESSDIKWLLNE